MVVDGRHLLEKSGAVDVERSAVECEVGIPLTVVSLGRDDVNSLGRVVEVSEIDVDVIRRHGLELGLGDEHFVLMLDDHLTLLGVEVHVRTVDLGGGSRGETGAALNPSSTWWNWSAVRGRDLVQSSEKKKGMR